MKRRVISLRDDRHIFTERYLHRREYHENEVENEVENDRLDDGGRPSRPATKDIKLKAEMARDGQLSTSNRSKMKVLAREKATFRNCLVSPDVVSLYKTTQFSNARPLSSLCYKRLRYVIHLPDGRHLLDGKRGDRLSEGDRSENKELLEFIFPIDRSCPSELSSVYL